MKKEVKAWWDQAIRDYDAACTILDVGEYYVVAFLCEQAVEKALKAVLLHEGHKVPKTHDLDYIGRQVELPRELLMKCRELSAVYLTTRYPDVPGQKFTKTLVKTYLAVADEVLGWTKHRI